MVGVNQLQSKVTDHPQQSREVLGVLLGICVVIASAGFDLDVLGEVDDEGQVIEFGLINGLLAVIYEVGCEQDGERKYSHIVVLLLICRTQAFCVQHKHLDGVAVRSQTLHRLAPDPNTLKPEEKGAVRH